MLVSAGHIASATSMRQRVLAGGILFAVLFLFTAPSATSKVTRPEIEAYVESQRAPSLQPSPVEVSSYEENFDVSRATAVERLELQTKGAVAHIGEKLEDGLGESFGGLWFDNKAGEYVLALTSAGGALSADRAAVASKLAAASLDGGDYRTTLVDSSWSDLLDAGDQLSEELERFVEQQAAQVSIDPITNAVIIGVPESGNPQTAAAIEQQSKGTGVDVRVEAVDDSKFEKRLMSCSSEGPWTKTCSQSMRGGVGIRGAGGGTSRSHECTSAFRARSKSDGRQYFLTAGHCVKELPEEEEEKWEDVTWNWESWDPLTETGQPIGTLTQWNWPSHDWAMIDVTNTWADSSPWSSIAYWGRGPDSKIVTEEYAINGEAESQVGNQVCHSGIATGTTCGTVTAFVKTSSVIFGGTIYDTWEVQSKPGINPTDDLCLEGGDSGGSVFKGHYAVGLVSFGGGSWCSSSIFMNYVRIGDATADLNVSLTPVSGAPGAFPAGVSYPAPGQATIGGYVYPNGIATNYHFDYGTTYGYGSSSALGAAGSGYGIDYKSHALTGLKSNTKYFFRIVAQNSAETAKSVAEAFTTPRWPEVTNEAASSISTEGATLKGIVATNGLSTKYRFEYGKTTAYGTSVPVPEVALVSSETPTPVSQAITGLRPEHTYHYRLVATNSAGTVASADRTFITKAAPATHLSSFGTKGTGNGQLQRPLGIAKDSSGNLWVADADNNRIQKFNAKGEYLSQFGTKGSGNGQLSEPRDIAFTSQGNLWVTDAGNGRIQEFTPQGAYVQQAGVAEGVGSQDRLVQPYGIAIDSQGRIWVTDAGGSKVIRFSQTADIFGDHFVGSWKNPDFPNPALSYPAGVAVDAQDTVWIADSTNNKVYKLYFDSTLQTYLLKGAFGTAGTGEGQLSEPRGIAFKPSGNLMIAEKANNRVQIFSPAGEYLGGFGTKGTGSGQMTEPRSLVQGAGGTIYVTDGANNRIQKWSQPWEPEATTLAVSGISSSGATLNGTVNPSGVATTYQFEYGTTASYGSKIPASPESVGSGIEAVAVSKALTGLSAETAYHYRVVASSAEGTTYGADRTFVLVPAVYTSSFGTKGTGNGQLQRPLGIAKDSSGNLWVADADNNRIQKFNANGEYLSQFGTKGSGNGQLNEPRDIAFTSQGNLWVTDAGNGRIQEFTPQGAYVQQAGVAEGSPFKEDKLVQPYGIAIDSEGRIWVTDSGNNKVVQFSQGVTNGTHFVASYKPGVGQPGLEYPAGITVGSQGTIWFTDTTNNKVYKIVYDPGWKTYVLETAFGTAGTGPGQLGEPRGIAFKPSGNLMIAEKANNRVQIFSPAGVYLGGFGTKGTGSGQMTEPRSLVQGAGGIIYVTDGGNNRIQKWGQPWGGEATTTAASGLSVSGATLNGTVNPSGAATTYRFEYGKTTSYGTSAPVPDASAGSGTEAVAVSKAVSGLEAETLYHYRIVATSADSTIYGADKTFFTGVPMVGSQGSNGNLWVYSPTLSTSGDTGLGMKSGTSPSVTTLVDGTHQVAFQDNQGELWLSSPTTEASSTGLSMAAGTNPSIAALPSGGYAVAFQANTGKLWIHSSVSGAKDTSLSIQSGTSPSIAAMPDGTYRVAYGASNAELCIYSSATGGSSCTGQAVSGNPAIAPTPSGSYTIAFRNSLSNLAIYTPSSTNNTSNAMKAGTSPAIVALPDGSYRIAYQASDGALTIYSSVGGSKTATGQAMLSGTSPSIAVTLAGGYEAAFQASSTNLKIYSSSGSTQDTEQAMKSGTGPGIG